MNKRFLTYIAILLCVLTLFASCSGESVKVEAGVTDASTITGIDGSEFAEGFDIALLETVGKHSVSVIVDGKTMKYTVEVIDTTAPVIDIGEIRINIGDGIAWKKQATVTDNSDGKIDIKVDSSSVNTSVAGTYTVTYTATDESGNSASASATVIVGTKEVTEDMLYSEIDRVISQIIKPEMNTEDKVRAIYAYVGDSINYASTAKTDDFVYAAYMALFSSGTGDCYSYFAASKAFFERLGIENIDTVIICMASNLEASVMAVTLCKEAGVKRVIAKCIIPQEKYGKSKKLFLNNAKKVSFDSFLNWLKLGDGVSKYIKDLFEEYISIPTLYLMGEDDKLFLPKVQKTVRNGGDNVSLIVVPDAGHVCNVDNKRFFNQHSLEFMCSVCK